ncbi:MAG TPA: SpoIIE family protein phosphatase, partial [Candidatus Ozemobacteraceae bacterium]|nr:SpoIIE family protein phosphatase [Candidatus Ozemobacteraceae bacterium]
RIAFFLDQFLHLAGRALGVSKTSGIAETQITLAPGEQLILYTDGFVEALSHDGSLVGYERCLDLFQQCRHDDPQAFVRGFVEAHHQLAPSLQDDSTLVIVSRRSATAMEET